MVKRKFRSAESYYGNTEQARKNQRSNITPGNTWQKRKIGQLRIRLFWEDGGLELKQIIYEQFENERSIEDVPKRELRGEKYIDNWWDSLSLEEKKSIRKEVLSWQTQKFRTRFFKCINRYLKEELAELSEE
ncbi:hypothetical protein ES695_11400 [Candidatus Atribacteria bacterium 1244-E10-H5-B2]|nr:MAG: hypothetical protein ES695_11400 [Candidatus Atribacteria bacterium 1244-E10-H5-B2]